MNALTAKELFGPFLIGKFITTQAIGSYPGGRAKVIDLGTDPEAPEIVMNVRHPSWKNDEGRNETGIFEWEEIWL